MSAHISRGICDMKNMLICLYGNILYSNYQICITQWHNWYVFFVDYYAPSQGTKTQVQHFFSFYIYQI